MASSPAAIRKYRQPPEPDDWTSWGEIWQVGLRQILSSYPFPQELLAGLHTYDPWKYGTASCDTDWRAGVRRLADFRDWQAQKSQEAREQRKFHNALNEQRESIEKCASRLEYLAERLEQEWDEVAKERPARGRFVATHGGEAARRWWMRSDPVYS